MQSRNKSDKYIIKNNVTIVAPRSHRLMTPFVLKEQNDWFEDEIKFLRHYIRDGMKILDIGANYGVYALTMAKLIGPSGRLWAFEPTASTASYLSEGIKANKFKNITLLQVGLSNKTGKAKLFTSDNAELNSLTKAAVPDAHSETISLVTLDYCMNKYNWNRLDFIKLDAEGEECNILKKGRNTLTALSPLIMFEFKHGDSVNFSLISSFKMLGYSCYRLIPVLNILVPFDPNETFDNYQLNIFCCKEDKSKQLEEEGWLVCQWVVDTKGDKDKARKYIESTGYGNTIGSHIDYEDTSEMYMETINSYLSSISTEISASNRVGLLMSSLDAVKRLLKQGNQSIEQLTTFSRIAIDAGERALGVKILKQLIDQYPSDLSFNIREPFLPATNTFDDINPDNNLNGWLFSSILEQFIKKSAFSSIFNPQHMQPLFERLQGLGFISSDMNRRKELIKLSMGMD